eukprot:CAMPEP_0168331330 /NCGR_PEP_ID=MMETSP0213-20121227/8268_1 /TAXON_ID=151035 /ORGANISM="Euplotes harpa, Strain FSP1.4" /LENGTH=89 /DNA_ID=CAMNT_0008335083 /DNA_START=621 /DNA_END=890 /DNA_ORIENTATION=+
MGYIVHRCLPLIRDHTCIIKFVIVEPQVLAGLADEALEIRDALGADALGLQLLPPHDDIPRHMVLAFEAGHVLKLGLGFGLALDQKMGL